MRETVVGEHSIWRAEALGAAAAAASAFAARVTAVSQIVWSEHCTECDYPRCYAACAFYDPRPDLNCRRFVAGVEASPAGLTRVRFRRWGKLEGRGPAPLWPVDEARRRAARDERVSAAFAQAPAPFAFRRRLVRDWNTAKARGPEQPSVAADAFVVEVWSADGARRPFTLTFLQDRPGAGMFQVAFELTDQYFRLEVPTAEIAASIDLQASYLVQIEPAGEAEGVAAIFGVTDFVALVPAISAPSARPLVKVVVWDLDETLWRGVLAEDGAQALRLRPEAVETIRALDGKGVLNAIASKNDAGAALDALRRFGLADYFLHPQIGWGPKSVSMANIAAALELDLDSFVFIDDQAFERAEVAAAHPAVRVLAETAVTGLADRPEFDHPVTAESAGRRALYQAAAVRRSAAAAAGDYDYLGFLRGSELTLAITPLSGAEAERVFELSQRTNQLNFTGAKFTRDDVAAMLGRDLRRARLTLACADRFGDYGLIGFADLDLEHGELAAFFMSCRVQRKRVEHAAFSCFAEILHQSAHHTLRVRFRPTARNAASSAMLTDLGFSPGEASDGGASFWERPLDRPFADADIVRTTAALARAA